MSAAEILDGASSSEATVERAVSEGAGNTLHAPKQSDTTWLDLSRSVIDRKDKKLLARALESNELPNVKVLFLEGNAGDVGMMAMLNALRSGYLEGLEKFILWEVSSYNQITTAEEGTDTIAAALEAGKLPVLDTMDFTGSLPKLVPARKSRNVIKELLFSCSCGNGRFWEGFLVCMGCMFCTTGPEKNQALECLRCSCGRLQVYSGNDGIRKIARALNKTPIDSLRFLRLQHNYVGDKGACSLAKILRRGKLPHLDELDLRNNPVGSPGVRKIVLAYLRNPLLTFRLRLDWPTFLLQQKAAGLRDSNIRLEHRMKKLNIPRDSIVINQYIAFEYYLKRPHAVGCFEKHSHRVHLLCQAQYGRRRFHSHTVVTGDEGKEPKGIAIRNRSKFRMSSQKQNVQRDLASDDSDAEAIPHEWSSSGDVTPEIDHSGVQRKITPRHPDALALSYPQGGLSCLPAVDEGAFSELPSVAPSEYGPSGDEMTIETPEEKFANSLVGGLGVSRFRKTLKKAVLKRKKAVLKRKTGVNRIYITSKSWGFVGAAKALGNQLQEGNSQQRSWLPKWIGSKFRRRFRPWQTRKQTERRMNSIKTELLILGERKPDEFYSLFGLRQVLLQNQSYENKYSRVWICKSCFLGYSERQVVHPVTTDDEVEPSGSTAP